MQGYVYINCEFDSHPKRQRSYSKLSAVLLLQGYVYIYPYIYISLTHFPCLESRKVLIQSINCEKYVGMVEKLTLAFETRFEDFRKHDADFQIFAQPFDLVVENIPPSFQLEIIELQANVDLKRAYHENDLLTFYRLHKLLHKSSKACEKNYLSSAAHTAVSSSFQKRSFSRQNAGISLQMAQMVGAFTQPGP